MKIAEVEKMEQIKDKTKPKIKLEWIGENWRLFIARASLPMLALAASYGVYEFSNNYFPQWVAIAQAFSFEGVYIGLAVLPNLTPELRKRATAISIGAVAVSVLYNSISGYLHRNPILLTGEARTGFEIFLALLHGVPLATLAYLVADLLLHTEEAKPEVSKLDQFKATIENKLEQVQKSYDTALVELSENVHSVQNSIQVQQSLHDAQMQELSTLLISIREELTKKKAEPKQQAPVLNFTPTNDLKQKVQNGEVSIKEAVEQGVSVHTARAWKYRNKIVNE